MSQAHTEFCGLTDVDGDFGVAIFGERGVLCQLHALAFPVKDGGYEEIYPERVFLMRVAELAVFSGVFNSCSDTSPHGENGLGVYAIVTGPC